MMKVRLMGRMMADEGNMDPATPDEIMEAMTGEAVEKVLEEVLGKPGESMPRSMTGGKLHYTDPKEKVKAGVEAAVAHGKKHGNR